MVRVHGRPELGPLEFLPNRVSLIPVAAPLATAAFQRCRCGTLPLALSGVQLREMLAGTI